MLFRSFDSNLKWNPDFVSGFNSISMWTIQIISLTFNWLIYNDSFIKWFHNTIIFWHFYLFVFCLFNELHMHSCDIYSPLYQNYEYESNFSLLPFCSCHECDFVSFLWYFVPFDVNVLHSNSNLLSSNIFLWIFQTSLWYDEHQKHFECGFQFLMCFSFKINSPRYKKKRIAQIS